MGKRNRGNRPSASPGRTPRASDEPARPGHASRMRKAAQRESWDARSSLDGTSGPPTPSSPSEPTIALMSSDPAAPLRASEPAVADRPSLLPTEDLPAHADDAPARLVPAVIEPARATGFAAPIAGPRSLIPVAIESPVSWSSERDERAAGMVPSRERASVVPAIIEATPVASARAIDLAARALGPARPLVLACGALHDEAVRLLTGRAVDIVVTPSAVQALRLAAHLGPEACFVSGALEGTDPERLIGALAQLPRAPRCVAVLDERRWDRADACRAAGADEVVRASDWSAVTHALRGVVADAYTRGLRAEAVIPLMVTVGDTTYAAESIDLRETGVALRDFPDLPVGHQVRLRLAVDDTDVWMSGQVARIFDRDGVRIVAVRFVDVTPQVQAWLARLITRLGEEGAHALRAGAWRADVLSFLDQSFRSQSMAAPARPSLRPRASLPPRASLTPRAARASVLPGATRASLPSVRASVSPLVRRSLAAPPPAPSRSGWIGSVQQFLRKRKG